MDIDDHDRCVTAIRVGMLVIDVFHGIAFGDDRGGDGIRSWR